MIESLVCNKTVSNLLPKFILFEKIHNHENMVASNKTSFQIYCIFNCQTVSKFLPGCIRYQSKISRIEIMFT